MSRDQTRFLRAAARRPARPQDVEGRRIAKLHLNRFADGRGGFACDPVIVLDDGTRLYFEVQETDAGGYGIRVVRFI